MSGGRLQDIKAAGMKSRAAMAWLRDHQLPAEPLCYSIAYEYLHTDDADLKQKVDSLDLDADNYREQLNDVFQNHILAKRYKQLSMQTNKTDEYVNELLNLLCKSFDNQEDLSGHVDKIKDTIGYQSESNHEDEHSLEASHDDYINIKEESSKDDLTQALDKDGLLCTMQAVIKHKENYPMSVVRIDIDKFALFNETNGKIMGDAVLKHISKIITNFVKGSDIVSRIENDEFILVLPKTANDSALKVAEELRKKVAGLSLKKKTSQTAAKVTVSMGMSEITPGVSFVDALEKAKTALNRSIDLGRNCVNRDA